jgi:hypothetical protein
LFSTLKRHFWRFLAPRLYQASLFVFPELRLFESHGSNYVQEHGFFDDGFVGFGFDFGFDSSALTFIHRQHIYMTFGLPLVERIVFEAITVGNCAALGFFCESISTMKFRGEFTNWHV